MIGRALGDLPILLLDDVSSELDPQRIEFLFEHLATLDNESALDVLLVIARH